MQEQMTTTRVAVAAAAAGALVAAVAGVAHGFGRDDETMYGATHIALGHLLPAVVAALTAVWLTALAVPRLTRTRDLLWLAGAQVGLTLWGAASGLESLGLYVLARTDPAAARHHASPALVKAFFVAATVSMLLGLGGALLLAVRRREVHTTVALLVLLGTPGAFVAGPVGDILLALGLGGSAFRALRAPRVVTLPPATGAQHDLRSPRAR